MGICIRQIYGIESHNIHDYTCVEQAVLDSAVNTLEARRKELRERNVCVLKHIFELAGIVGDEYNDVYLNRGCLVVVGKERTGNYPYPNKIMAIYATPSNKGGLEKVVKELKLPAPKI